MLRSCFQTRASLQIEILALLESGSEKPFDLVMRSRLPIIHSCIKKEKARLFANYSWHALNGEEVQRALSPHHANQVKVRLQRLYHVIDGGTVPTAQAAWPTEPSTVALEERQEWIEHVGRRLRHPDS